MLQVPSGRAQVPSQVARVLVVMKKALARASKRPHLKANATRQRGELVVDDVVVLEVLLQLIDIINLHHHAHAFAEKHDQGVDQRLGGFAPDISFLTFVGTSPPPYPTGV